MSKASIENRIEKARAEMDDIDRKMSSMRRQREQLENRVKKLETQLKNT